MGARTQLAGLAGVLLLFFNLSAHAMPIVFDFSFSDDPTDDNLGNTHVAGTVSGRIFGLSDNAANQQATSLFVDSHPNLEAGFGPLDVSGIDLISGSIFANSFDVFGGVITDLYFISNFSTNNGGGAQLRLNSLDNQEPGANVLRHRNGTGSGNQATGNRDGLTGFASNSGVVPIPEPGTLALLAAGFCGIYYRRLTCRGRVQPQTNRR